MSEVNEQTKIRGTIIAELFVPGTDILVDRYVDENIICKGLGDAITTALSSGTMTKFNYMVISTGTTAVARATAAIEATRWVSTIITPTVSNTASTSTITYITTFAAGAGKDAIRKFGMESATPSGGVLCNEYLFPVAKDNATNDLKLTYVISVAP